MTVMTALFTILEPQAIIKATLPKTEPQYRLSIASRWHTRIVSGSAGGNRSGEDAAT